MLRTALEQASCLRRCVRLGPEIYPQQIRGTCIVRRVHPTSLRKKGERRPPTLKEQELTLVEHLASKPWGDMQVILAYDVEGLGVQGDLVTVSKRLGRNKLLLSGLAVYPSPENIAYYKELCKDQPEKPHQSIWAQKTVRALETMNLQVPMSPVNAWIVNKTHLRVAFRRAGVELAEDCLTLPPEPISEPGEYKIKVLVNKLDEVTVNAIVYHHYDSEKDAPEGAWPQTFPPTWGKSRISLQLPSELPDV